MVDPLRAPPAVSAGVWSVDAQLQEAIFDFERTAGVVETITSERGSKSAQLKAALEPRPC